MMKRTVITSLTAIMMMAVTPAFLPLLLLDLAVELP